MSSTPSGDQSKEKIVEEVYLFDLLVFSFLKYVKFTSNCSGKGCPFVKSIETHKLVSNFINDFADDLFAEKLKLVDSFEKLSEK